MVSVKILLSVFTMCHIVYFGQCYETDRELSDHQSHQMTLRDQRQLALYPRVGKRSPKFQVMRRRDFLNFLADSWQKTGSLRGAIHEIQDMTESKRDLERQQSRPQQALVFPAPRVGKSDPELKTTVEETEQNEISKKWAMARVGKKWAAARIGKKSVDNDIIPETAEKRVPFARVG